MVNSHKNKDYSPHEQTQINTHLNSLFELLKIETSDYCEVNISVSIKNGVIADRIDSTIHHIHKKSNR